jgi:energy-coupling factor transporter ATP-binding protein EcfA2
MADWDTYPNDYRAREIDSILRAVRAGESVSVIGLSGAGKSNLLGFLFHRAQDFEGEFILVDCNRLTDPTPNAFWQLIASAMGASLNTKTAFEQLERLIYKRLNDEQGSLCFIIDRFDVLTDPPQPAIYNSLRVLRDVFKYRLTFVVATRRPLDSASELAELFYAQTLWLGPLSDSDARWNVQRYAARIGAPWEPDIAKVLIERSGGYPSLLRAVCEAHAAGAEMELASLSTHPAVQRRLAEFWRDSPSDQELEVSGLKSHPLLRIGRGRQFDTTGFTAKEQLLYETLQAHQGQVCSKDALILAVWPEDQIYDAGVRDDSLAQLVRRLRVKIEVDPSHPQLIKTVPGRGYRFEVRQKPG